jgi:hypothetical protein
MRSAAKWSVVLDDLNYQNSRGFGAFPIHGQLLLTQLDACLKLKPDLLNQTNFVNIYLSKLRPGADADPRHDPAERRAYLDRRLRQHLRGLHRQPAAGRGSGRPPGVPALGLQAAGQRPCAPTGSAAADRQRPVLPPGRKAQSPAWRSGANAAAPVGYTPRGRKASWFATQQGRPWRRSPMPTPAPSSPRRSAGCIRWPRRAGRRQVRRKTTDSGTAIGSRE